MTERFWHLVLIILATGVTGGIAAFLSEPAPDAEAGTLARARRTWQRFLLLGVVAAACVPLFLSLLKSGLIEGILDAPDTAPKYENYLIFIGLCLVAAVSARRFIDSITQQLIRRLDEVDAKAGAAAAVAAEARVVAHEAVDEMEAAEDDGADGGDDEAPTNVIGMSRAESPAQEGPAEPVTPAERRALAAMMKRKMRTATGIAEDSGVSRSRISELLEGLADKGLARPATSPRTGGARWAITDKGRAAVGTG